MTTIVLTNSDDTHADTPSADTTVYALDDNDTITLSSFSSFPIYPTAFNKYVEGGAGNDVTSIYPGSTDNSDL